MKRYWHRDSDECLIKEICPRGKWTGFGWGVKVGSASCTEECEYCVSSEMSSNRLTGIVECCFNEHTS